MPDRVGAPFARPAPTDIALIIVAVAAVSTSAPLIREAAAPSLAIAFWRNGLGFAATSPFAWRLRGPGHHADHRTRRLAVLAGVILAAHFATWVPSLSFTSVASSVALVATQPVWAAMLARWRGDVVPGRAWLGILVALAGVIVLVGVDVSLSGRALVGDLLALAGGFLAAAYVTVRADVRRTLTTTTYTTICYGIAAAALGVGCAVSGTRLVGFSTRTWVILLAITAGPQLLGHSLFNRVLRTTSPTIVSVAILFEVVGATLIAYAWFGERPPAAVLPAAALICAGVVLVILAGARIPAAAPD